MKTTPQFTGSFACLTVVCTKYDWSDLHYHCYDAFGHYQASFPTMTEATNWAWNQYGKIVTGSHKPEFVYGL